MTNLIVKSNIKKIVRELDESKTVTSVANGVEAVLENQLKEILRRAIIRAYLNGRKTLHIKDL